MQWAGAAAALPVLVDTASAVAALIINRPARCTCCWRSPFCCCYWLLVLLLLLTLRLLLLPSFPTDQPAAPAAGANVFPLLFLLPTLLLLLVLLFLLTVLLLLLLLPSFPTDQPAAPAAGAVPSAADVDDCNSGEVDW